jgi:uncharacterized hydantoinase/oxoprolinase family protein
MEDKIKEINIGKIDVNEFSFEEIKKISNKVDWKMISWFQILSEEFIREFSDRVNWDNIYKYQKLSEEFIREFADKVNWNYISFEELSDEFIIKFHDKFNWNTLDKNNKINKKIFKKMNREQKLYMLMNYRGIWEKYNGR